MCPYGTYVLLGSLKCVLRGRKVTKYALKELRVNDEYVHDVMWTVTMSLSCVGVSKIVSFNGECCKWLMLGFLGSWKNCVLVSAAALNAGGADKQLGMSWLDAFDVSFSSFSPKGPNFTI